MDRASGEEPSLFAKQMGPQKGLGVGIQTVRHSKEGDPGRGVGFAWKAQRAREGLGFDSLALRQHERRLTCCR